MHTSHLVLARLVVPDGVSLIEDDPVPVETHHALATLALATGGFRCCGEGFLPSAGGEVARQGVVCGDDLRNASWEKPTEQIIQKKSYDGF